GLQAVGGIRPVQEMSASGQVSEPPGSGRRACRRRHLDGDIAAVLLQRVLGNSDRPSAEAVALMPELAGGAELVDEGWRSSQPIRRLFHRQHGSSPFLPTTGSIRAAPTPLFTVRSLCLCSVLAMVMPCPRTRPASRGIP